MWLLATAAVLPLLLLAEREASALVGSLVLMAYSFTAAVLIQAATETRAFGPDASPVTTIAFGANGATPSFAWDCAAQRTQLLRNYYMMGTTRVRTAPLPWTWSDARNRGRGDGMIHSALCYP